MLPVLYDAKNRLITSEYLTQIRALDQESYGFGEGVNPTEDDFSTDRRDEIAFDAIGHSIKRFRRIGRLWISAAGAGDKEKGESYSPPQIVFPAWRNDGNQEQLDFARWQFDNRLTLEGMRTILDQICDSCLESGRAIVETDWQRESEISDYPQKIVSNDFLVHPPEYFVLDPVGLPPGIYLKPYVNSYNVSLENRLPDGRFMVVTANKRYGNKYGVSEFQLIDKVLKYFWQIYGFHARGLERSGVGAIVAKYSKALRGKANEAARADFILKMKQLRSNTVTVTDIDNLIESLPVDISVDGFDKFEKLCLSIASLVGTGSPTTLIENQHGTYAQAEATDVSEKSDLEQNDATLISDAFTYQFLTRLLDLNFAQVPSYPVMQIIEPKLIQPTINQDKKDLIEVQGDQQEEAEEPEKPEKPEKPGEEFSWKRDNDAVHRVQNFTRPSPEWMSTSDSDEEEDQQEYSYRPVSDAHDYFTVGKAFISDTVLPSDIEKKGRFIYHASSDFAENEETEDEQPPETGTSFPVKAPAPDIYGDVKAEAETFLRDMPVLNPKAFNELEPEDKHNTFTLQILKNVKNPEQTIEALKQAIADTLDETNEAKAWERYLKEARVIFRDIGYSVTNTELIPSFRFARGKAYSEAINAFIEENEGSLFAIRYHTQDDSRVRFTHRMFEGLTRPVNDPVWEKLKLPLGFGCRCWLEPVSLAMQERETEKYKLTPDDKMPENFPEPFKDGYEPKEEEDATE